MSDERPAARLGDPIAHSNAMGGLLTGLAVGLAVGVLVGATIATGGGALVVMAGVGAGMGLTSFGALAGKYIGEGSMGSPCGNFVTGSPNVMINHRPATMTLVATAACADHSGTPPLATGAATVFINGKPAGRLGERVGCSALAVGPASPDVMIGGPSAADPAVVVTPEVPAWAVTALQVMGVAGAVMALPYAIATVGVAATIGGGAGGYLGAAGLGAAGHALGKAMGLSETGVRSLEVGGQFLGGLVGGGLGAKGVRAAQSGMAARAAQTRAVDFAKGWQGKGDYPGVDPWRGTTLQPGTKVYGGTPGQGNFYMDEAAVTSSGGSKQALWEGLQVKPHDQFGYRPAVQAYEVQAPTPAAVAPTVANPQYGSGGFNQIAIEDFSGLKPVGDPIVLR